MEKKKRRKKQDLSKQPATSRPACESTVL